MRYFITLSYDGTQYHGWQIQPNGISVQETLQQALSTLLRCETDVVGAGRTDAGVHAKMMVAHFDYEETLDCPQLTYRLNKILPQDAGDKQLYLFIKNLGWNVKHLDQVIQIAALYDEQAISEHLEKLHGILRQDDEIDCFLCDIAFIHGKKYSFRGEILDLWKRVCLNVFGLDETHVDSLENVCKAISGEKKLVSMDAIKYVSPNVIDYYVTAKASDNYLIIDLSGGSISVEYSVRTTSEEPDWRNTVCRTTEMWLRRIPAGTFMMGSPSNELGRCNNETQHFVTLTQDFFIGVFPVTQLQWKLVMGSTPSFFKNAGPDAPVEKVSYNDICGPICQWPANTSVSSESFLGKLREKTGLEGIDLPTEAQWEYACRAGTKSALNNGMDLTSAERRCPNMDVVGWYEKNSGGTQPVGQKLPNNWGLYDMHGNVWEWCRDRYEEYKDGNMTDPRGSWLVFSDHVYRGGGWNRYARFCRSAYRDHNWANFCNSNLGFRIICI